MELFEALSRVVAGDIQQNISLSPWTSLHVGGPARYFYTANDPKEIVALISVCQKMSAPYFILGGGSNVVINDKGFDGLVIRIGANRLKLKGDVMECDAGVLLNKIVGESISMGFSNMVWATGIPGTFGGAIHNNAGAYGQDMAKSIIDVTIIRNGKIKKIKNKDCKFEYRGSIFKQDENKDIIVSATLRLERGDMEAARQRMKGILKERKEKFGAALTAGSVFKNVNLTEAEFLEIKKEYPDMPESFMKTGVMPAAWLIDQCGLKGKKVGDAQIMTTHAGIIANCGKATAEEIIMFTSIIKQKVRMRFNIQLQEEIEYVGF